MEGKVTKEFEFLALDGSNFPSWAMDVKVQLSALGLYRCIDETTEGTVNPSNMSKFSALKVMRNHIHPDLKMEYMYEEDPRVLWTSLKNRYEHHKAIVLPEAMHEWNHLRYRISKLWMSSIMSFIRFALSFDFVRENLLKRTKLRKLCL
jgi:hypothetical protein